MILLKQIDKQIVVAVRKVFELSGHLLISIKNAIFISVGLTWYIIAMCLGFHIRTQRPYLYNILLCNVNVFVVKILGNLLYNAMHYPVKYILLSTGMLNYLFVE